MQKAHQPTEDMLFYDEYYDVLQTAIDRFVRIISALAQSHTIGHIRFPIEHYKTRIKSADSTKAKLVRLGFPETVESAQEHLYDLVGARIVCQFIDDIYALKQKLEDAEGLEIYQIKDYIQNPKSNGYRSLHMIVMFPIQCTKGIVYQPMEIQMRTIAMDFWASLEHELKYKKNIRDAALMFSELKRCAEEAASLDLSMQAIYEWLNQ